jgi:hypothetical protein
MKDLVFLKNDQPVVSTFDIFEGFGYKSHRVLKRVIHNNRVEFEKRGNLLSASTDAESRSKMGRPDTGFLLNERQFVLLILLAKNSPESIDLKGRIENEFHRIRQILAGQVITRTDSQWKIAREGGKEVRKTETDTIKEFVEYAHNQGSENARNYYTNLSKMENKALFLFEQHFKNMREMLSIRQLALISSADQIIEKALKDGMDMGMEYREIYAMAKDRVVQFANIVGKSMVVEFQDRLLSAR